MAHPSIGVVTPSYNQAAFIEKTIQSVLNQKYPSLQYWVIDGGSTDGTIDILKKYKGNLQWISEKDNGQTHAINKGMKKLTTEIVCYLNSDDLFTEQTLWKIADIYQTRKFDWLVGSYGIINEKDDPIHSQSFIPTYKKFLLQHYSPFILKSVNSIIPQPSTFWSMEAMKHIGFFNENLRYAMDYDYWLRLSNFYTPVIISDVLSLFRIHSQSKSGTQYVRQFAEELEVLVSNGCTKSEYVIHWVHTQLTKCIYTQIK